MAEKHVAPDKEFLHTFAFLLTKLAERKHDDLEVFRSKVEDLAGQAEQWDKRLARYTVWLMILTVTLTILTAVLTWKALS